MSLRIPNGSGDGLISASPFQSFLMGGFECSTLCLQRGERIDMVDATQHDKFALLDYKRMQGMGLLVAREGLRWHLIEHAPGRYDFSSVQPIVQAARVTGTQVIWDLCHFGWPDDLDIWKPEFVERLARMHRGLRQVAWRGKRMGRLFSFPSMKFLSSRGPGVRRGTSAPQALAAVTS